MKGPAADLVAAYADRAKALEFAEQELRRRLNEDVARAARQRAFAFRRLRLIRTLADAATPDAEAAMAAQLRAVSREIGWSGDTAAELAVLERLRPVAIAVRQCACGESETAAPDVAAKLEEFESWFEGSHGKPFYALFDQYVPEVPVVDF